VVNISSSGTLYCAAFRAGDVPSSVVAISTNPNANTVHFFSSNSSIVGLTLRGLSPDSSYDMYCYTDNFNIHSMPLSEALISKTFFTTKCCKRAMIRSSSKFIYQSFQGSNIPDSQWLISLNAMPRAAVQLNLTVSRVNCATPTASLQIQSDAVAIPRLFSFDKYSRSLDASFILRGTVKGCYFLQAVVVSPSNKDRYLPVNASFTVESWRVVPDAPLLKSATFSVDGYAINVLFTASTDRAIIALSNNSLQQFNCSLLLKFPAAGRSRCRWTSDSVLTALVGVATTLPIVGDVMQLLPQTVRAACIVGTDCSAYPGNAAASVRIVAPLFAMKPVVLISSMAYVSYCDNLIVDASMSYGAGGRLWTTLEWTVDSNMPLVTVTNRNQIRNILTSQSLMAPITVSKDYLIPSAVYNITLRLTNFLLQSSISRVQVAVSGSSEAIPSVQIYSSSTSSFRWKANRFFAAASYSSCAMQPNVPLLYEWSVYNGLQYLSTLQSSSKDPRYLVLAPFSLQPSTLYTIVVSVSVFSPSNVNVLKSNASVLLNVGISGVLASIAGGSSRVIRNSDPVVFDASGSYDADYPSDTLTFQWSCSTIYPNFGEVCKGTPIGRFIDSAAATITIASGAFLAGIYNISLTVSNPRTQSAANTSVLLTISENQIPSLYIDAVKFKFNPTSKVIITGYITKNNNNATATWSTTVSAGLYYPFTFVTPTTKYLTTNVTSTTIFQLGFICNPSSSVPNSFAAAGQSYSFKLQASYERTPNLYSSAVVTIIVNAPPASGNVIVSPNSGFVLTTLFNLITNGWVDDISDLPLRFEFRSLDLTASSTVVLRMLSEVNFVNTYLGQGLRSRNYAQTIVAVAYDIWDGYSNTTSIVKVGPPLSGADVISPTINAVNYAFASYDTSAVVAVVGAALSSVNSVDCNVPVACNQINRMDCKATARTCGSCMDGFVGILGDSNIRCQRLMQLNTTGEFCRTNSTCITGRCSKSKCVDADKSCPGDCGNSGRTACIFTNINGSKMLHCSVTDPYCFAECKCAAGSFGRDCSLSRGRYQTLVTFREFMCSTQYNAGLQGDSSLNSLFSAAQIVTNILSDSTQISSYALFNCSLSILLAADNLLSTQDSICSNEAASTIVNALSAVVSNKYMSQYPKLLKDITSFLWRFGAACASASALGEAPATFISNNIYMLSVAVDSQSGAAYSLPQSNVDKLVGSIFNSISLASQPSTSTYHGLTISQYNNNPSQSLTLSTGFGAQVYPIDSLSSIGAGRRLVAQEKSAFGGNVTLVLINNAFIEYRNQTSTKMTLKCLSLQPKSYKIPYKCHNSTIFNATCPAYSRGVLTVTCPGFSEKPQCLVWDGLKYTNSSYCEVKEYDHESTTCVCSSHVFQQSSANIFQQQFSSSKNTKYYGNFQTFEAYEPPSKITHDSVVVSTISTLVAIFIVGLLCHLVWDRSNFSHSKVDMVALKYTNDIKNRSVTVSEFFESLFPDDEFIVEPWFVKFRFLLARKNCWFRSIILSGPFQQRASKNIPSTQRPLIQYAPVMPDLGSLKWTTASAKLLGTFLASAVLFYLVAPDDGTCQNISAQYACVHLKSRFHWFDACKWKQSNETCEYSPPPMDFLAIISFIFIILIASAPVETIVDVFLQNISLFILGGDLRGKVTPENLKMTSAANTSEDVKESELDDTLTSKLNGLEKLQAAQTWKGLILRAARLEKARRNMDFVPPSDETLFILQGAERAFHIYRKAAANSKSAELSVYQIARYGFHSLSERLVRQRVQEVRLKTEFVLGQFETLDDAINQQIYLMREFVVDYFEGYQRQVIKNVILKRDKRAFLMNFTRASLHFQRISFLLLPLVLVLFIFFIIYVGDKLGSNATDLWLLMSFLAIIADVIIIRPLVVFLDCIFIDGSVNSELRELLFHLQLHSRIILRRTTGVMRDANALIQHFNPSCRAARIHPKYPISRLLLSLSDYDVPLRKRFSWYYIPFDVATRCFKNVVYLPEKVKELFLYVVVVSSIFAVSLALFVLTVVLHSPAVALIILIPVLVVLYQESRNYAMYKRTRRQNERLKNASLFSAVDQLDVKQLEELAELDASQSLDTGSVFSPASKFSALEKSESYSRDRDVELISVEDDLSESLGFRQQQQQQHPQQRTHSSSYSSISEEKRSWQDSADDRSVQSQSIRDVVAGPPLSSSAKRIFQNSSNISYTSMNSDMSGSVPGQRLLRPLPVSPNPYLPYAQRNGTSRDDPDLMTTNQSLISVMEGFEFSDDRSVDSYMPRSITLVARRSPASVGETSQATGNERSKRRVRHSSKKAAAGPAAKRGNTGSNNRSASGPGEQSTLLLEERDRVNATLQQMHMGVDAAMPIADYMSHSVYSFQSTAASTAVNGGVVPGPGRSVRSLQGNSSRADGAESITTFPMWQY